MKRLFPTTITLGFLCIASTSVVPAEDGFISLFNGRDLSGWVEWAEPGAFAVEDGLLVVGEPRNYPNWLRTERHYENFILRMELKMPGWCESGIYLHAPLHGRPSEADLKIHVAHEPKHDRRRSMGSLFGILPPITDAGRPADEWNDFEIYMDWPRLRVTLNGELIQDVDLERIEALRRRIRSGYIGLEDIGCRMRYRNLRIRELPSRQEWTSMANQTDLTGWTVEGDAQWTNRNGTLIGSDGDGYLVSEETYGPFEFQTYFRTTPNANGGVFFRGTKGGPRGYEIQIYNVPTATYPTGSIYNRAAAVGDRCQSGEWCLLQIESDGAYAGVLLNGKLVAEYHGLTIPDGGLISLQMHSRGRVEYREPRIRPLREASRER